MNYRIYNTDENGNKTEEILGGSLDEVFPMVTNLDRLEGKEYYKKLYIEADEDTNILICIKKESNYKEFVIKPENDDDTEDDVINYNKHRLQKNIRIVDDRDIIFVAKQTPQGVNEDDFIAYGDNIYTVEAIEEAGEEMQIRLSQEIPTSAPNISEAYTPIKLTLTANEAKPFWVGRIIEPNTPKYSVIEYVILGIGV